MNKISILALLSILCVALSPSAQARSWFDWIAPPLEIPPFERPNLYDGKTPHVHSWQDESWDKESWSKFRGSQAAVIGDFYDAGILIDQYKKDDSLVLEVGQPFMRLSNADKLKVASYIDHVYKVTETPNGMFVLIHDYSDDVIGVYTQHGLQLQ